MQVSPLWDVGWVDRINTDADALIHDDADALIHDE